MTNRHCAFRQLPLVTNVTPLYAFADADKRLHHWQAKPFITPQSPVRIRFPQLEPQSSETTRPRGFVLRWGRDGASYPLESQGFATLWTTIGVSLPTSRATRSIHTLGPPTPRFWPKLSAVSLSRAAWVKRCWLRSFGRNLPGLASGACNGGNRNDSSRVMILRSSPNAIRASQGQQAAHRKPCRCGVCRAGKPTKRTAKKVTASHCGTM